MKQQLLAFFIFITGVAVAQQRTIQATDPAAANKPQTAFFKPRVYSPAAAQIPQLLKLIQNKNVALLVNQTAMVGNTHLVDTLLTYHIPIKKIFAPEHGFRGNADAGEHVKDSIDKKTGIPVISLYGNKTKPSATDLKGIDIVIFDVQDVGARFYTFISTLHYLMEACAENNKQLIVLDRANPNGYYVDGPVLKKEFQSFVGVDPIPVVHGLTVAEYALMVNGEKWLPNGAQCKLEVIKCQNFDHAMIYDIPLKPAPSPNLPNALAVQLYPSLCFFEGTNVSVGRGTDFPFQAIGAPKIQMQGAFVFTPVSKPGAKNPPLLGQKCYGYDMREMKLLNNGKFTFQYVIDMYTRYTDKNDFFLKSGFFDKLCGNAEIRKMIEAGKTAAEIEASYQKELKEYKTKRKKYLLYRDFE